jgi:hypothetical protein
VRFMQGEDSCGGSSSSSSSSSKRMVTCISGCIFSWRWLVICPTVYATVS